MKTNNPHEKDDSLNSILRAWDIRAPLPPHFREAVWQRIEQHEMKSEVGPRSRFRSWIESVFPRTKIALCYVTVQLLLGMTVGLWLARQQSDRLDTALGSRYVQSIDPFRIAAANQ